MISLSASSLIASLAFGLVATVHGEPAAVPQPATVAGPLRVLASNPHYFTRDGTKAVYLTGSHTWSNLVDMGESDPPKAFDFGRYLDFLDRYNHNFIRLWSWELVAWEQPVNGGIQRQYISPQPWKRTGPGLALDHKPKFDLAEFDPAYFDRLRARVEAASRRGIYVSIMLFEGWAVEHVTDGWKDHPFHKSNNLQGIDGDPNGDGKGAEVHTLQVAAVREIQERYVRHVVDTVGGFDNVLFEIANESGGYSTEWQYHFIRHLKDYEKTRAKQHPVGMTFAFARDPARKGTNAQLFEGPADWISPNPDAAGGHDYRCNPPPADGSKVILADTDHLWGEGGDVAWVWKSFSRGLQPIYMDRIREITGDKRPDINGADQVRRAMGAARRLADRIDLARMTPHGGLASSGYCLADPGHTYLVFKPEAETVSIDLAAASGSFRAEWIDPVTGATTPLAPVTGGGKANLQAPGDKASMLLLSKEAASSNH